MKVIIDEKVCLKHKMTLQEFLIALAVRSGDFETCIENLVKREVLVDDKEYLVTQHWSDVVDEIICDSTSSISDERLVKLATDIQNAFPEGFKRDERTGAKYYHKSNKNAIKIALKRFITYYGDYPDEEIIDATRRYVASFNGNYKFPFQMANYFVYKDNRNKGGDITSQLATFLENKESEEGVVVNTEEWTSKMI